DSAAYNLALALRLRGDLDVEALQSAFTALIERHETLRTTFRLIDEAPRRIVRPPAPVTLLVDDLSEFPDAEDRAKEIVYRESRRRFDLEKGPLLRVTLLRLADADHSLLVTTHHIVADAWSPGILH